MVEDKMNWHYYENSKGSALYLSDGIDHVKATLNQEHVGTLISKIENDHIFYDDFKIINVFGIKAWWGSKVEGEARIYFERGLTEDEKRTIMTYLEISR